MPAVGDRAAVERTFTVEDIDRFAELTGDVNPVHLEDAAAQALGFDRRVVHGALVASLFSRLLGTVLPGAGTIYLGQDVTFRRPVYANDEVTAAVEVTSIRTDKPILELRTWVEAAGNVAVDGRATVLVRRPR